MTLPPSSTEPAFNRGAFHLALVFLLASLLGVALAPVDPILKIEGIGLAIVLSRLIYTDLTEWRLPNPLTVSLILIGLLVAVLQAADPFHHFIGAAVGYGVIAVMRAYYLWRRGTEGIGLGDAKLTAAIGAWFGWFVLPLSLLIAAILGLMFAVFTSVIGIDRSVKDARDSKKVVPFGPALCTSFMVFWLSARGQFGFLDILLP